MKEKYFGFIINDLRFPFDIKATTEKQAFLKLINKHWSKINNTTPKSISITIESLGELNKS